jgi:hypothetical protein
MRVEVGTEAHLEPLEYLFEVSDEHRIVGFGVVRRGATPAPGLERDRVVLASGAAIRSCLGPGATPPNGSHLRTRKSGCPGVIQMCLDLPSTYPRDLSPGSEPGARLA